jgi:drug/metabolite transporter (DMT)-like permease
MSATAFALVLLSAAGHAWWNFLLKRSGGTAAFIGLSKAVEVLLLAPVVLVVSRAELPAVLDSWWAPVGGAALVLANYGFLARAYRSSDLSVVYPISRGAALAFLPPLAFVVAGERIDAAGAAGLALVVAGIAVIQLPAFARHAAREWAGSLSGKGTAYALLAALATAGYTLWDQAAVRTLSPVTYFFAYTVLVAAAYAALLLRRTPRAALAAEWGRHRSGIVQVAALNSGSYLLMLAALRDGKASYALGTRQTSIAFGMLLGWLFLAERMTGPKQVGGLLIIAGCILFGLAR